jgi:thiamine kinase-like enzyme
MIPQIPQDKSDAVSRGLEEAFGTATIEDVLRITRGLSSDLVFRIVVKGTPYLLRIMTRINEQMDPHRIYACMSVASDGGITPRVHYTHAEDGVSITDFVKTAPLSSLEALQLVPLTLRTLHALPPFLKEFNYITAHKAFIGRFRTASLLPQREIDEVFAHYDQLCAIYPRLDEDIVSSHMDLKPDNILFDGDRIWLVDWQAGFLNDRYFDLAVAANCLVSTAEDESAYLEHYFGQSPDEYQQARFFLMRQFLHAFSASVSLMLGSGGQSIAAPDHVPSFEEFYGRVWDGEVNFADKSQQITTGFVHWNRLLGNLRQPRFEEAMRIVSSRHGNNTRTLFPVA